MLSPVTPLDPYERRDELARAMLIVALVVDPVFRDAVDEATAHRPPCPGRDASSRTPVRHVPRRHVRPPRAC